MSRTRKIQVTLDEQHYRAVAAIARRDGRKLASVVRESIEKYCVAPQAQQAKERALEALLSLPPTPVPDRYQDWERQYGALKTT